MSDWQLSHYIMPKPHTEVLAFRDDAGIFMATYTYLEFFLTVREIENSEYDDETLFRTDWWSFDQNGICRLQGDEIPTHWMPLPGPPKDVK